MIPILIIIISFLLDGILSNFLPYVVGNLSLFTPLFTIVCLFLIYPFYQKKERNYFLIVFFLGLLYDLVYTNLLFFNAILFLLLAVIISKIYHNLEVSALKLLLYIIGLIIIYETTTAGIIWIWNLVPMSLPRLIYKISHSLLLNIIYAEIIYGIIYFIPNKYKKININ